MNISWCSISVKIIICGDGFMGPYALHAFAMCWLRPWRRGKNLPWNKDILNQVRSDLTVCWNSVHLVHRKYVGTRAVEVIRHMKLKFRDQVVTMYIMQA